MLHPGSEAVLWMLVWSGQEAEFRFQGGERRSPMRLRKEWLMAEFDALTEKTTSFRLLRRLSNEKTNF